MCMPRPYTKDTESMNIENASLHQASAPFSRFFMIIMSSFISPFVFSLVDAIQLKKRSFLNASIFLSHASLLP